MSDWLQRYLQPQINQFTGSRSQSAPTNPSAPGRTTYISTNTAEHRAFYAQAPAGSRHAARLQKLALEQQPEYRAPKPHATVTLERKAQRSITAQGEPLVSNDGITSPASRQRHDTTGPGCADNAAASPPATSASSPHHIHRSPGEPLQSQSRPPPLYVDRYERDGLIAYHKKAAGGELLISAPVGSQEARQMDDAAARVQAAQAAYSTGRVSLNQG